MKHPPAGKLNKVYPTVKDTDKMIVYAIRHNWTGLFWGLLANWSTYPKLYTRLDRVEKAIVGAEMDKDKIAVISWELREPLIVNMEDLNV